MYTIWNLDLSHQRRPHSCCFWPLSYMFWYFLPQLLGGHQEFFDSKEGGVDVGQRGACLAGLALHRPCLAIATILINLPTLLTLQGWIWMCSKSFISIPDSLNKLKRHFLCEINICWQTILALFDIYHEHFLRQRSGLLVFLAGAPLS